MKFIKEPELKKINGGCDEECNIFSCPLYCCDTCDLDSDVCPTYLGC